MLRATIVTSALILSVLPLSSQAQTPAPPQPPMSFFITSAGKGDGASLGGFAGKKDSL